jgi:hypothetical protein
MQPALTTNKSITFATDTNFEPKAPPKRVRYEHCRKDIPSKLLPLEFDRLYFLLNQTNTRLKRVSLDYDEDFYPYLVNSTNLRGRFYRPVIGYDKEENVDIIILASFDQGVIALSHDNKTKISVLKTLDYENIKIYLLDREIFEVGTYYLIQRELVSNVLAEYGLNPNKRRPSLPYLVTHCRFTEEEVQNYNTAKISKEFKKKVREINIFVANIMLRALTGKAT